MYFRNIDLLESDKNKKGDLFCRLMGDLFHAIGYDDSPRFNIHQSGREIDIRIEHRTEKKVAIAECKAHHEEIGGSDINKFIGVLDAEKRKLRRSRSLSNHEVIGYFVSLSGFKETAIEQELDLDDDRVILIRPEKIISELIAGRMIVPQEQAITSTLLTQKDLKVADYADLFAYSKGWVWVIYYSNGQRVSHYSLVHADGKPLIRELAEEILDLDKSANNRLAGLEYILQENRGVAVKASLDETRKKYFSYLQNECGEIQFEGLPTDKDAGSVKVKLENIFVPLFLESLDKAKVDPKGSPEVSASKREGIGTILNNRNRLAILAKPGGGKSTLVKRLAIAYAYPERRELVSDGLPANMWFPIFIRCRELGEKVTSSITDIISNIPTRAEISYCVNEFAIIVSDVLQKGQALLLIDGLDEIAEDKNRILFVNQLRTFLATYPNTNVIITSREAGFRIVAGTLASYCAQYRISNLNEEEIESLCLRWHKAIIDDSASTVADAKALSSLILKDKRISALAENPLLLTTLLFVKRWAGYLPTKKSVLYQEMIKLLLVTWNVEGYEQLDIDEAEPQLSFVAYWMTSHGKQTIAMEDLKNCLVAARQQMPDILGYTKISVPDFIRRVESRSSLLILSGHQRLASGQVTPIYEFLHLSFQEYLTAKAVVEKYLPRKEAKKSTLAFIKPHIENETWKEIVPLMAVLSKRDTKELIEYLIAESKKIAEESSRGKRSRKKISPPELLGNCLANEIQIDPGLLDLALEWTAKNRYSIHDKGTIEIILNSKFGSLLRQKVHHLYFDKFTDQYASAVGGLLGEIHYLDSRTKNINIILSDVLVALGGDRKEDRCIAILTLMEVAFLIASPREKADKISIEVDLYAIYSHLLTMLQLKDLHYSFAICWAVAWSTAAQILPVTQQQAFALNALEIWLSHNSYNICRVAAWALSGLIRPSMDITGVSSKHSNVTELIKNKHNNPQNEYDKIIAVCAGINMGMTWDATEIGKLFNEGKEKRGLETLLKPYAEQLNIPFQHDPQA